MKTIPEGDYYSCTDEEYLTHTSPEEAVEEYLESSPQGAGRPAEGRGTDPITVEMHIATGVPYSARCHHLTRTTCIGCPDDATCKAEGRGALLEQRLLRACRSLHKRWKEAQLKSCKPLFCGERCEACCERVSGSDMVLVGDRVYHNDCWAKRRSP